MSFNKIILVGNLGRDPELRYTPQGTAVCSFSMATNEKRRDKSGESQNIATWFRITLWGSQAENASKYLAKGRQVYIEGRLRLEEYTDRDGNNRQSLEVNGSEMQFLGGGERNEGGGEYSGSRHEEEHDTHSGPPPAAEISSAASASGESKPSPAPASGNDDDIPF